MQQNRTLRKLQGMPFMTYALLLIQIVVFILMTFDGGSDNSYTLVKYGAKLNSLIIVGQWWRLITPVFVHIGLMHIVVNSITLYYIGQQIEGVFGHLRFLLIYLISGVAGNLASFAFNADALSAGASTALFGLFGAYLMLADVFRENPYLRATARQFIIFILLNLVFGFVGSTVDNAGHIGGLIGGFLAATAVGVPAHFGSYSNWRKVAAALLFIIAFGFCLNRGLNLG